MFSCHAIVVNKEKYANNEKEKNQDDYE